MGSTSAIFWTAARASVARSPYSIATEPETPGPAVVACRAGSLPQRRVERRRRKTSWSPEPLPRGKRRGQVKPVSFCHAPECHGCCVVQAKRGSASLSGTREVEDRHGQRRAPFAVSRLHHHHHRPTRSPCDSGQPRPALAEPSICADAYCYLRVRALRLPK